MGQAEEAVDVINAVFGRHAGSRASHAKGTLCRGTFRATPAAAALTRAAHMSGDPVDATVRFSNSSGRPDSDDRRPDVRGMAATFHLPDGSRTDVLAATMPCFVARTPEDFIAFTRATLPSPRTGRSRLLALGRHLLRHPESVRGALARATMRPVRSYACCRYEALHAYRWVDREGRARSVRYRWLPLSTAAAVDRKGDPNFLRREIAERLAAGTVRFAFEVQIAGDGDPTGDATRSWPSRRRRVVAGTLELDSVESPGGGEALAFDPARLTDGIELSDDPLVPFRSEAYAVSVARRS
ncbi:MAG TPA: catalase [Thermoleophilaceae bacterium]